MILLQLDYRHRMPNWFTHFNQTAAYQFQDLINQPLYLWNSLRAQFHTRKQLVHRNYILRDKLLRASIRLQQLDSLIEENQTLRQLMKMGSHLHADFKTAEVVSQKLDPLFNHLIINRGTEDDAYVGQPVLDAQGIIGQIIAVEDHYARVALITDRQSLIPVQTLKTRVRGILQGQGAYRLLRLNYIPENEKIQEDDLVITSGIDSRFPPGYPIGRIETIKKASSGTFLEIEVKPLARLHHTEYLILLWPNGQSTLPDLPVLTAADHIEDAQTDSRIENHVE